MRSRIIACCLCWVLILISPVVLAQQTGAPNQSWDALRQILSTGKLKVEKRDGRKLSGSFKSISDTDLLIERKGTTATIPRAEVKNVWQVSPPDRAKQRLFAGIGVGIGLLSGLALAVPLGFKDCGGNCTDEGAGIVTLIAGFPAAGALIGRSMVKGKSTLIYSAP